MFVVLIHAICKTHTEYSLQKIVTFIYLVCVCLCVCLHVHIYESVEIKEILPPHGSQ